MLAYACLCLPMLAYACLCLPMLAYACLCLPMLAYACLCLPMIAYACLCLPMLAFVWTRNHCGRTDGWLSGSRIAIELLMGAQGFKVDDGAWILSGGNVPDSINRSPVSGNIDAT